MQRTVNGLKYTYAHTTLNEIGELNTEIKSVVVQETNEKKALKKAFKMVGTFAPLKVEPVSQLYVLDDEIFFKYAVPVDTPKKD